MTVAKEETTDEIERLIQDAEAKAILLAILKELPNTMTWQQIDKLITARISERK